MARVPYHEPEEVPQEYRSLMNPMNPHLRAGEGVDEKGWDDIDKPRNTHRALANNPKILDAYRRFGAAVWQDSGLNARERELVILAVARQVDSPYEWHQHSRIALSSGVSEDEVKAIADWDLDAFEAGDRALLEYTAAFVEGEVEDETHDTLVAEFDNATVIGVTQLAGYYLAIDRMGRALDLDFEEEFVGWHLENR